MLLAFCNGPVSNVDMVPKDYSWEQLVKRLSEVKPGEKNGSYLLRGGAFSEPKRAEQNLLSGELLIIDADSRIDPETGEVLKGAPPIETAKTALDRLGYRYIVHTSYSYDPSTDYWRYRIFIPAILRSKSELGAAVKMVIAQLHAEGCYIDDVPENSDWARAWFLPRAKPELVNAFKCYASLVGRDVDVTAAKAYAKRTTAAEEVVAKAQRELPQQKQTFTAESPIALFNRTAGLDTVRLILEGSGYKFAGKKGETYRFIAPQSETRTPGVVVFKGSQRGDWVAYSHHGAHDPLSHRLNDAFGMLTRLRHKGNEETALAEAKQITGWKPSMAEVNLDDFDTMEIDAEDFQKARADAEKQAGPAGPIFIRSKAFADSWKPAEYLIDGLIQRGYCYSLTSPTGHGKTALIMMMSACIGTGQSFAGAETAPGRVGYFAAENPNDVQARWIGMQESMGFDDAAVWFCPETVDLETTFDKIAAEVEAAGGFDLVVVDTSQAFFRGEDENSNAQMVNHAKAMRKLTQLPGNPCVVILTHPIKNPSKDNLLPRGGGGFLAEVDGNLTLWNDNGALLLHHQGKFRGAGFSPVNFALRPVTPARLKDARGRQIPTVVAEYLTEEQYNTRLLDNATDQDKVMILILNGKGKISIADMAKMAGWMSPGGNPHKGKVHRILMQLREEKLARPKRNGRWALTDAGLKEIKSKAKALGIDAAGEDDDFSDEF